MNISSILAKILVFLLGIYRHGLSPLLPHSCRFWPNCSLYMQEAVKKRGPYKGMAMGFTRLLKCHPFNPGGHDPVR